MTFDGTDDDALIGLMRGHLGEAHEIDVTAVTARNAIERERALGPIPAPREVLGPVSTRPLSPALVDDFAGFFDDTAFTDNVGWASCYCMFHHLDGSNWGERTWQENRAEMLERIRAGKTTGILAYVEGVVAGWACLPTRGSPGSRGIPRTGPLRRRRPTTGLPKCTGGPDSPPSAKVWCSATCEGIGGAAVSWEDARRHCLRIRNPTHQIQTSGSRFPCTHEEVGRETACDPVADLDVVRRRVR